MNAFKSNWLLFIKLILQNYFCYEALIHVYFSSNEDKVHFRFP
jgi:hypothetical protein